MNFLPNRLQRDVLKRHAGPFLFCFFTIMFLLLMQFLVLYSNELIGKGLPAGAVLELIITNLAYMVVLASPMATLVACLMAFGKFTELNELTALRAAGVNPWQVISPVLYSSVLLAVFLVWFSNDVLPDANQKAKTLFVDIKMKKPGFDLQPDQFYEGIEGYTFLVDEIDQQTDSLYNVTLFQEQTRRHNKAVIRASRGRLESSTESQTATLRLQDGSIIRYLARMEEGERVEVMEETAFDRYRISFDLSELAFSRSDPDQQARHERTMDIRAMRVVVDSLREDIRQEKQGLYRRADFADPPAGEENRQQAQALDLRSDTAGEQPLPPPYRSKYHVLNTLESAPAQKRLREAALGALRDHKSSYDNVIVNTDWRVTRIARYLVEIHKKVSIPMACVIFVLLGAPVGMYSRKGSLGYAALIGTGFLTFYWISVIQGEKLADRLWISPFWGMWFGDLVLGVLGLYLTVRICTSFRLAHLLPERLRNGGDADA